MSQRSEQSVYHEEQHRESNPRDCSLVLTLTMVLNWRRATSETIEKMSKRAISNKSKLETAHDHLRRVRGVALNSLNQ